MLRSLYTAGTGMITQRAKMDVIINNITNMDTIGYKNDQVITRSFSDLLLDRLNDPAILNQTRVGGLGTGIHVDELVMDFKQGPLEQTDNKTDMAIVGPGYFCVNTPQGMRYTRAGNFQVNNQGMLLTQEGYQVLGQNGQALRVGSGDFTVNDDGSVFANGQQVGALRIVQFADEGVLRKVGDNLLAPYNNEQPAIAQNIMIKQGFTEGSNVEAAREVADMMMTNRVYESSQRMLRMIDESLSKTVNEIAKF